MIVILPFVFALVGAAAAGAAAAGGWVVRRTRRARLAKQEKDATQVTRVPAIAEEPPRIDEPIDLGDVLLVDGGRRELWLVRRCELSEGEGAPFLVLFEADGPAERRALVVVDPADPSRPAVLGRVEIEPLPAATGRAFRPPSTLDVPVDGHTETLRLTLRRAARAKLAAIPDAELVANPDGEAESPLPRGEEIYVATYEGGPHVRALLMRVGNDEASCFAGRSTVLGDGAILRNRQTR